MKQELLLYLQSSDSLMSRTAANSSSDTSVSQLKKPLLCSGQALQERLVANRQLAVEYILWRCNWFCESRQEHLLVLCGLAQLIGFGLLPEGLLRTWPYDTRRHGMKLDHESIPPATILLALEQLVARVLDAKKQNEEDRIATVARVEWEIGVGPIHPFYDGCGRVSRYYSSLLSLWLNLPLAHHTSREEYFNCASKGREAFVAYYRTALQKGATLGP